MEDRSISNVVRVSIPSVYEVFTCTITHKLVSRSLAFTTESVFFCNLY